MIGRYCMVRIKNAGVFAGTVARLDGHTTKLADARRIWYWDGAATFLSLPLPAQVSLDGANSRLP